MRLADCDTLQSTFELWLRVGEDYNEAERNMLKAVIHEVKTAPTVDAVPVKRGQWNMVDEAEPIRYGCSKCNCLSWYIYNFCPNCGAKMDGERRSE